MTTLPLLSGQEAVKVFVNLGWEVARQRGSHIILVKTGHPATLSVPDHREVARGDAPGPDPESWAHAGGVS